MALTIDSIRAARARISAYTARTPLTELVNLNPILGCRVFVKEENRQYTGAYKLRGAFNVALSLSPAELERGLVAASSGNHGRALAYAAKTLGTKALIVIPETAPKAKIEGIRALGAEVVLCPVSERFAVAEKYAAERNAVLVPPFNDETVMAGQGTLGLELIEQQPDIDTLVVPVSGGGLIGGVSTAVKAVAPLVKIYGAEPAVLPRYSVSLAAGKPVKVEQNKTVADALVSAVPGSVCFPYVRDNTDGMADVTEENILRAWRLLLLEGKILAEPSSCIGIGAVLQGAIPVSPGQKVCFVLSGGNIGPDQVKNLL